MPRMEQSFVDQRTGEVTDFNIVVTHPKYVKAIKGKKTDKRDAQWCRFWVKLTSFNTSEKNRAQNCLTWGNYKLDAVFTNVFGKSSTAIVDYMLEHPGEKFDVTPFVNGHCKTPISEIQEAVDGDFPLAQAEKLKIIKQHMTYIADLKLSVERVIFQLALPYEQQIELLTAIRIITEIGVDMSVFDSAKHLISWAGLCPQNAESAGKKKITRVGKERTFSVDQALAYTRKQGFTIIEPDCVLVAATETETS